MILAPSEPRETLPPREASYLVKERVRQSFENVNDRNYDERSRRLHLMGINPLSASTTLVGRRAKVKPGVNTSGGARIYGGAHRGGGGGNWSFPRAGSGAGLQLFFSWRWLCRWLRAPRRPFRTCIDRRVSSWASSTASFHCSH